MPNRKVHIMAGIMSGTAVAGYRARNLTGEDLLLELAGGCLGGLIGGIVPDVFEPAINSWHRSVAHSGSSCLASAGLMQKCATLQQQCRAEARRHTQLKLVSQDDCTRFWHAVMAGLTQWIYFGFYLPSRHSSFCVRDGNHYVFSQYPLIPIGSKL
jgi:hypothetical protein